MESKKPPANSSILARMMVELINMTYRNDQDQDEDWCAGVRQHTTVNE